MTLRPPTPGSLVLLVAGGLMVGTAAATSIGWAVVVLLAAALVVTAVHVAAHLGVARALGVPVYTVLFGGGPRLIGAEWGTLAVELRSLPVGGSVAFYPDDVDPEEAVDPPAQAVLATLVSAPIGSLALAAVLLGPDVLPAVGLVPAQLAALMFSPSTLGLDVARSALQLTDGSFAVLVGTVAAKLGVGQIPANLMLIVRSAAGMFEVELSDAALLATGLLQIVITTWVLFGFVYALSLALV